MKKAVGLILMIIALSTFLCACSQQNLVNMASGAGDEYATIVWGEKVYVPYGALAAYGEHGKEKCDI